MQEFNFSWDLQCLTMLKSCLTLLLSCLTLYWVVLKCILTTLCGVITVRNFQVLKLCFTVSCLFLKNNSVWRCKTLLIDVFFLVFTCLFYVLLCFALYWVVKLQMSFLFRFHEERTDFCQHEAGISVIDSCSVGDCCNMSNKLYLWGDAPWKVVLMKYL